MNRRKFIGTCACCACIGAGVIPLSANKLKESKLLVPKIERLGVHLAEHCNLNCKYCSHYSCIAEKEFYDLDKFKQDVERMSYLLNKKLAGFQLLGGEPLLNPKINEYVKIVRNSFPDAEIHFSTNAVLLDSMDKSFWETLSENNAQIVPSLYPIKINWESILKKAEKYNVGIYTNFKTKKQLTLDDIKNAPKDIFYKMAINENGYKDVDQTQCDKRYRCQHLSNGKFFPCYFISTVRHLNKKFGTKFVVTEKDYLDIYKVNNIKEIENFISKTDKFPFCNYCSLNYEPFTWESAKEHDLSEWI